MKPTLQMVISGAQTGADQGGLEAALARGFPTGGWCPSNCMMDEGERENLLELLHAH